MKKGGIGLGLNWFLDIVLGIVVVILILAMSWMVYNMSQTVEVHGSAYRLSQAIDDVAQHGIEGETGYVRHVNVSLPQSVKCGFNRNPLDLFGLKGCIDSLTEKDPKWIILYNVENKNKIPPWITQQVTDIFLDSFLSALHDIWDTFIKRGGCPKGEICYGLFKRTVTDHFNLTNTKNAGFKGKDYFWLLSPCYGEFKVYYSNGKVNICYEGDWKEKQGDNLNYCYGEDLVEIWPLKNGIEKIRC